MKVQLNPLCEEQIAFDRGSHLVGVHLFGKRAERLHRMEVRFEKIHGKCEKGYYTWLRVINDEFIEVAA